MQLFSLFLQPDYTFFFLSFDHFEVIKVNKYGADILFVYVILSNQSSFTFFPIKFKSPIAKA